MQEGHTTTEGPAPPHPQQTPHNLRGRTPPTHAAEARIGRRTDHTSTHPAATRSHTGDGGHTYRGRTGYTHRGSRCEHRRAAHHHVPVLHPLPPRAPQGFPFPPPPYPSSTPSPRHRRSRSPLRRHARYRCMSTSSFAAPGPRARTPPPPPRPPPTSPGGLPPPCRNSAAG